MIGDKLIIEKHHTDIAGKICKIILKRADTVNGGFAVAIAGESGSGKSELAFELCRILEEKKVGCIILQQDDYFVYPPRTNHEMRKKNLNMVGTAEVKLDFLDSNVRSFKRGENPIYKPLVNYNDDKITTEELDAAKAKVLIAEGTYTTLLQFVDLRVFIDRDYINTKKSREKRARDKYEPFINEVLKTEHQIISGHKDMAHIIVEPDFKRIQVKAE
jgi:uridine kinase